MFTTVGKEIKKMKKQLKEAKKKNKTQEVELEKALAKVLLYEEQHQYDKHGCVSCFFIPALYADCSMFDFTPKYFFQGEDEPHFEDRTTQGT